MKSKGPNDPSINRAYNYLYEITNTVNGKVYIGVHRTDNLNDGYMGSGKILKRAQNKHGIYNFKKKILCFFPTYQEALEAEKNIVTLEFIENDTNYNIKEGGFGSCKWSSHIIKHLSDKGHERWSNNTFREKMLNSLLSPSRRKKISLKHKEWIKNNPLKHKQRMEKINKNPNKIEKTRQSHLGTKRPQIACENISQGLIGKLKSDIDLAKRISGKGTRYIYNPMSDTIKRIQKTEDTPDGWVCGTRPQKGRRNYNICKGLIFAHDPNTLKSRRFKDISQIPENWVLGRPRKK
jgi:hypothetical protein